jgi:single-stranded DNA-binding protein
MAFLNMNNVCMFEGRLAADPEGSTIKGANGDITQVRAKLVIDRGMKKDAKEKAQKEGKETADFIPLEAMGPKADFIKNYFTKGSPIKVVAAFKSFSYMKDGQKVYGHNFDVVDATFTVSSANGNGGNTNGGGNTNNAPSYDATPGFQAIDDDDLPF